MDSSCIMMDSCSWYQLLILYSIAFSFIGYIVMSLIMTLTILASIVRSRQ